MKNNIIQIFITFAVPLIGFAQEPEMVTAAESSSNWPSSELVPMIGWPLLVLFLSIVICFVVLIPFRKRNSTLVRWLRITIPVLFWSVWYFYPSCSVRGNYYAEIGWDKYLYVSINDKYHYDDFIDDDYKINPLTRLLWVKLDQPIGPAGEIKELPVKLRWNHIYQPVFKRGWVKFKRENKANQQVEPIVTTPVDEVEVQSTQAHPERGKGVRERGGKGVSP